MLSVLVRMHATANGFPLDFFGPFLPLVSNAHGIVNAELRMFGTLDSIQLEGDAALEKSTVVISNTNVPYRIDGSLSFNEDEIRFDSLLVKNLPTDDQ
jgi:autotransporter translocation and assembly factor TamB